MTPTHRPAGPFLSVLAASLLSACATITTSTNQTIAVNTDPPGALCSLKRNGGEIAYVNPTPGNVAVGKASADIEVKCSKEGYQDASSKLGSSFQAMTFGNILIGGVIGVAVDAASGAMFNYPASISLTLAPTEFRSEAERDHFYAQMTQSLEADADKARKAVLTGCAADKQTECAEQVKKIDAQAQTRAAEIEVERQRAKVRASL